jgi:hypothetical protein
LGCTISDRRLVPADCDGIPRHAVGFWRARFQPHDVPPVNVLRLDWRSPRRGKARNTVLTNTSSFCFLKALSCCPSPRRALPLMKFFLRPPSTLGTLFHSDPLLSAGYPDFRSRVMGFAFRPGWPPKAQTYDAPRDFGRITTNCGDQRPQRYLGLHVSASPAPLDRQAHWFLRSVAAGGVLSAVAQNPRPARFCLICSGSALALSPSPQMPARWPWQFGSRAPVRVEHATCPQASRCIIRTSIVAAALEERYKVGF